jgi:hypothetical protein
LGIRKDLELKIERVQDFPGAKGWRETLNKGAGLNPMSVPADKYFTDLCFTSTEFKGLFKEDR